MKLSAPHILRRFLAVALCGALMLPLLASCSGGGKGSVTTPAVTFAAPEGEESLAGLTDPYCTNQRLFETGGRVHYRGPAMYITNDGTLVAVIVQRFDTVLDDSPEKYVAIRRSTDGGLTWTEDACINYQENYCVNYNGGVYDAENDTLLLFLTTDAVLEEALERQASPKVLDRTYIGQYIMKSTDSGATWQMQPFTLSAGTQNYKTNIYGNDHGVQLAGGPYAGRLVIGGRRAHNNYLVYSDDGGSTWVTGAKMQDGTGECGVTALPDGSIYVNSRNYTGDNANDGLRREAWSLDGGVTAVDMRESADLIEPCYGCNASVITFPHPETGETVMLYSGLNCYIPNFSASRVNRYNLSVWISYDEGKTWPVCKVIEPDISAYSSLTYDPETGLIYLLYEAGHEIIYDRGANLVTCNLAWLESDDPLPAYTFTQPAGTWQEKAANSFAGGSGTEEDPFLVATAEELALIARLTNYGQDLAGIYFKQVADIDLAGCEWSPIGRASSLNSARLDPSLPKAPFSGHYDGDGHIISNLTSNLIHRSDVGLFGYVENATIRNVFVKDGLVRGAIRSSGVVGWVAEGNDETVLENCFYQGIIRFDDPEVEQEQSGLYDVSCRGGASVAGDLAKFPAGTTAETATALLPIEANTSWLGFVADSYAGGDGSEQDPYQIATAEQLARLPAQVNAGHTLAGQHFVLTADIDLSAHDWQPIGVAIFPNDNHIQPASANYSFEGVLDGAGHTVSGMHVNTRRNGVGFFSYLCGGTVRNLSVQGEVVGASCTGGFVGFLRPNSETPTVIENCFFEGKVTGMGDGFSEDKDAGTGNNVGGFIGRIHQASGCSDSTVANNPLNGTLRNLYCKAVVVAADKTNATVTLFFGGQYKDKAAWTASDCYVVSDLPENAGITLYHNGGNVATGITSARYDEAYAAFRSGTTPSPAE